MQSVEVKVDATLLEQLRAGHAEMSAIRVGEPRRLLAASETASSEEKGAATTLPARPRPPPRRGYISKATLLPSPIRFQKRHWHLEKERR